MPRRVCFVLAFTLLAALATQPAAASSPGRDGRIAYLSEPNFAGAFVESVPPSGGATRRLSGKLPHGSDGLSFAPDGKRVALTIQKPDGRHVQILSGGKLRDLARGRAPAWSPDGRWIAFLSGQKVGSAIFLVANHIGLAEDEVRALTFFALIGAILSLILANRTFDTSLLHAVVRGNRILRIVFVAVLAMAGLILAITPVRAMLQFAPLDAAGIAIAVGFALALLVLIEMGKMLQVHARSVRACFG